MVRKVVTDVDTAVTLRIWVEEDGAHVGEVFAPSQVIPGTVVKVTLPDPIPAIQATETAIKFAASRGLELVVADPHDIWGGPLTLDDPAR